MSDGAMKKEVSMISLLEGYIQNSLPDSGKFYTHSDLVQKVDREGNILPYYGNTTVFLLREGVRERVSELQEELYRAAPEMLAERLRTDTLHMTLHSLADGVPGTPGLEDWMECTHRGAREYLEAWKKEGSLHMQGTWMFNMCRTSIVLGLAPADEDSWGRLQEMYGCLERVRFLGYDMTPHITLAYFRPGTYDQEQVNRLRKALREVNLELQLDMNSLVIQNFQDMNRYETVW